MQGQDLDPMILGVPFKLSLGYFHKRTLNFTHFLLLGIFSVLCFYGVS